MWCMLMQEWTITVRGHIFRIFNRALLREGGQEAIFNRVSWSNYSQLDAYSEQKWGNCSAMNRFCVGELLQNVHVSPSLKLICCHTRWKQTSATKWFGKIVMFDKSVKGRHVMKSIHESISLWLVNGSDMGLSSWRMRVSVLCEAKGQ